jgi:hypothetical protein
MATEQDSNDDLYSYDGYDKIQAGEPNTQQTRLPRQDFGVDFTTMVGNFLWNNRRRRRSRIK